MKAGIKRIFGNWLTAFLSPLLSNTIVFNLAFLTDTNLEILLSSFLASSIVTGLVIAQVLQNGKQE